MSVEKAMHDSVVVYDLSDRTQIEITGTDRAKLLHGFCTNDIKALQPGQGCEALLTNIKGRVLGQSFDAFALIPFTRYEMLYGRRLTTTVSVKMPDAKDVTLRT